MSSIRGLIGHKYTPEAYTTTTGALTLLTKSVATRYAKDTSAATRSTRARPTHPSSGTG
jgi:hypothetical protein